MKKKVCIMLTAGLLGAAALVPGGAQAAQKAKFTDINVHYAQKHVQMLSDKGIVSGIGMGKFGPDQKISKEHLEMLFKKASGKDVKIPVPHRVAAVAAAVYAFDLTAEADKLTEADIQAALSKFTDKDMIPAEDLKPVAYMVKEGIVSGVTATEFKPHNEITRGEVATILGRLADKGKITLKNHMGGMMDRESTMKDKQGMMKDKQGMMGKGMMTADMKAMMDAKMADMKGMMEKHTGTVNELKALLDQLKQDGKLSAEQQQKYEELAKKLAEYQAMMDKQMQDMMGKDMKGMTGQNMKDMTAKGAGMAMGTNATQDQKAAAQPVNADAHAQDVNG